MPLFAVQLEFPDPVAVDAVRPTHRAYLAGLHEQGALVTSGPWADGGGALLIFDAPDEESARALVDDDPYLVEGVATLSTIREWNRVY